MIRRVFRFIVLGALGAAVFSAVRKLTRPGDQLPTAPVDTGEPWPPLRPESTSSAAPQAPAPTPPAVGKPAPTTTPAPGAQQLHGTEPAPADETVEPTQAPAPSEALSAPAVAPEPAGVPVPDDAVAEGGGEAWVEPTTDGGCPDGHPIKANLKSKIFHSPGQLNYERTSPDRCYADAAAAEADGLRAAKR